MARNELLKADAAFVNTAMEQNSKLKKEAEAATKDTTPEDPQA